MKKLGIYILALSLISNFSFTNVKAETSPLPDGDMTITQNVIDVGEAYADMMEETSRLARTNEEVWTVIEEDTEVLVGFDTITGSQPILVPSGETITRTRSWSVSAGKKINSYTLSAGASGSLSISQSGPAEGTTLTNGYTASHRAFFVLGKGKVCRYYYEVTDKYTGAFLREEEKILIADQRTERHSQYISVDGNYYYVQNSTGTNTIRVYSETYLSKFTDLGSSADNFYDF